MLQIRLAAAILAGLTLALAALLNSGLDAGFEVIAMLAGASLCLLIVATRKARRSAERDRLTAVCVVNAIAICTALGLTFHDHVAPISISALLTLAMAASGLAFWATKARKSHLPSVWANYYDN